MSQTTEHLSDGLAETKHEVVADLKNENKECKKALGGFSKGFSEEFYKLGHKTDGLVKRNSYKFIAAGFAGGALTIFGLQAMFRNGKRRHRG